MSRKAPSPLPDPIPLRSMNARCSLTAMRLPSAVRPVRTPGPLKALGMLRGRSGLTLLALGAVFLSARPAGAQSDVERPLPNVMLLVDSSGSMEFRAEDNALPVCTPGNSGATNEKSRWIELLEVMTGSYDDYSCFAMDRSTSAFVSEFSVDGVAPYDENYINPYHRALSGNCLVGPGVLPSESNPFEFPAGAVNTFQFTAPATVTRPTNLAAHAGCAAFDQASDGVLDVFKDKVRFGLMTFDTHPAVGTGLDDSDNMDAADGAEGTWSYYVEGMEEPRPAYGRIAFCEDNLPMEVGSRNAAAPPWEGRMVAFGPADGASAVIDQRNAYIQQVLMATRPYGATPLAGMLDDARAFLWHDETPDPLDASGLTDFGPYDDPQTKATDCRRSIIVLLSDGEPNLDLRPHCEDEANDGECPYDRPEDIAYDLYHNPPDPDQKVEVVVVGFALDRVTPINSPEIECADLTDDHCTENPNNRALQACCTLNKIAAAGGPPNTDGSSRSAYFPQDGRELRRTLSRILKDVTVHLTTRTSAVFASNGGNASGGSQQFSSSFVPLVEQPWSGQLTRTRILCEDGAPEAQEISALDGDDFAANVNSGQGPERKFFTYVPEGSARASLRPFLTTDPDGVGLSEGEQTDLLSDTEFVAAVSEDVMEVDEDDCEGDTATECRDAVLGWTVGLTNSDGETRCAAPGSNCNVFGAIYHATPRVVSGAPNDFLRDESYAEFARAQASNARPSVLYAATIDGQLHALKTAPQVPDPDEDVSSLSNNELWSFFPPAVLPVLQAQYPNTPATLLDGPVVVRDVSSRQVGENLVFERTQADAQAGAGGWNTILVEGFGRGQVGAGYFALDITNPEEAAGGPRFLWQLTQDDDGDELFGEGGTPLITTLFIKSSSIDAGKEVAVAVLPGGDKGSRSGSLVDAGPLMEPDDDTFDAEDEVNGYTGAETARTLTIVRLDTGEVIRSFRSTTSGTALSTSRITQVDIPAPIVGQPAAFPGATGAVADRIFVGDREGRLWRVDVSSSDPAAWTMDVFFDLYFDQLPAKRQPIELAPVVSVDGRGQITVAAATGEQRVQTAEAGMLNRVVSLTEVLSEANEFQAKVNWVESLGCTGACLPDHYAGERVTGPMSLFGGTLFFASSAPRASTTDQCAIGTTRVWGLNYTLSADEFEEAETVDPMNGAAGGLPPPPDSTTPDKATDPSPGTVFGVSIEQQPSCSTELAEFEGDPYLGGYGNHTALSTVTPAKFFLVYQVGGVSGSTSSQVTTEKLELSPPRNTLWIDSWAPIFE